MSRVYSIFKPFKVISSVRGYGKMVKQFRNYSDAKKHFDDRVNELKHNFGYGFIVVSLFHKGYVLDNYSNHNLPLTVAQFHEGGNSNE